MSQFKPIQGDALALLWNRLKECQQMWTQYGLESVPKIAYMTRYYCPKDRAHGKLLLFDTRSFGLLKTVYVCPQCQIFFQIIRAGMKPRRVANPKGG